MMDELSIFLYVVPVNGSLRWNYWSFSTIDRCVSIWLIVVSFHFCDARKIKKTVRIVQVNDISCYYENDWYNAQRMSLSLIKVSEYEVPNIFQNPDRIIQSYSCIWCLFLNMKTRIFRYLFIPINLQLP